MDYPQRLHHGTPAWVKDGALFHIRIRIERTQLKPLTAPDLSPKLLKAARDYHDSAQWWCELFLLMPDHLHAMMAFPAHSGMATVVRNWKRGAARMQGILWQKNFFDHRLRSKAEAQEKWHYIRLNPVVKGLCSKAEDWPHWYAAAQEAC